MKKWSKIFIILITSLLAAYKTIFLGSVLLSRVLSSVEIAFVGTKSISQIFVDFLLAAVFFATFFYFMRSKQRVMMTTSLLGLVCHLGLVLWTANII